MENTKKRDEIFQSVMMRSIDDLGAAYKCYQHLCSEIRRGKLHQKPYLHEYAYFHKATRINTTVSGIHGDIRSLANYKYPVKALCNSISCD